MWRRCALSTEILYWLLLVSIGPFILANAFKLTDDLRGDAREGANRMPIGSSLRVNDVQSSASLQKSIQKHTHCVVLYYAAWCPHSQALSAAVRVAADVLVDTDFHFFQIQEQGRREAFSTAGVSQVPELHYVVSGGSENFIESKNKDILESNTPARHIFDGNRSTVALIKWLLTLRNSDPVLPLLSMHSIYLFAMHNFPTAIAWLNPASDHFLAITNGPALPSHFRKACNESEDVLCGVINLSPTAHNHAIQKKHLQERNSQMSALNINPDGSTELNGKETPHVYFIGIKDLVVMWSTISIFPSVRSTGLIIENESL